MKYIRHPDIVFRHMGDEGLALSTAKGEMVGVNESAATILEALSKPKDLNEIWQTLNEQFEGVEDPATLAVFVQELADQGLIQQHKGSV
jgi:hypothetical protein